MEFLKKLYYKVKQTSPSRMLVFGFFLTIVIGGLLLCLPISSAAGEYTNIIDCMFTSTSAVCVTGLVVLDTGTYWSAFGKTVIICLIQIGGLGFMTMTTLIFLFIGKKISLPNRILLQSSFSLNSTEGVIKFLKSVLFFTFITEFTGAVLLSFSFIPKFGFARGLAYSFFHAISAFCNAGFDLIGGFRNMTPFVNDPIISITIMLLIVIGGLGFAVVMDIVKQRKFKKLLLQTKLVLLITGILIFGGALLLFIFESNNPLTMQNLPAGGKALASFFQSISPRTAGFNTISMSGLTSESKFLTILLMFIGGSPGSTAGGIKTVTFGILFIVAFSVIRGKNDTEVFKRKIHNYTLKKAITSILLALLWVTIVIILLGITEHIPVTDLAFEVVSAFGTVGLSVGITPNLADFSKILLMMTMFFGRLGLITISFALAKKRSEQGTGNYSYPDGNILL